jgi:hypothetical protein
LNRIKFIAVFAFTILVVSINFYCTQNQNNISSISNENKYLNHDDSVKYVGINTCKQCHGNIYETFIKTGMGKSFDLATHQKSSAIFGKKAVVYDKFRNFYYKSFWKNDSMFIYEYRLNGKDTTYKRIEKVNYIVGSGQHTNSHLCIRNGYVTQMPMTFYTQSKQWDLPPGFENGANTRFGRNIGLECMSCHNSYPEFEIGSENKYNSLPNGIGCERCHGPGEAHVAQKKSGNIVDTSKYIDYSIVNPAKLSIDLQFDVCQRCHLQGNAVLKNNHSFYDFKPGLKLSDYISVFLPRYKNADDEFIMASHADRLKQSKCFIKTFDAAKVSKELRPYKNGLTCISCHNPHVSVKETNKNVFNDACKKCHSSVNDCSLEISKRKISNDNCVSCHMPKSGSIDIPHVTVHDHWIRKPISKIEKKAVKEFIGLQSVNETNPSKETKATAYLNYYEKFSKNELYLDSAFKFLNLNDIKSLIENIENITKYYFFRKDSKALISKCEKIGISKLLSSVLNTKSFENKHAWSAYRIGEAYLQNNEYNNAILFFKKSIQLAPYYSEFKNKLGAIYQLQNRNIEAEQIFQEIINEQPTFVPALSNLGYMYMLKADYKFANYYLQEALKLDPDFELALLNLANLNLQLGEKDRAKALLKRIIQINSKNVSAINALRQLNFK